MTSRIYMDTNATSPLRPEARAAMRAALDGGVFGNPSSVHAEGREARKRLDAARAEVANALGARPAEVVFTSSATEANNLALSGVDCSHLATTAVEHPSVLETARALDDAGHRSLTVVPVDALGAPDLDALDAALDAAAGRSLVSVIAANNETGVVTDLPPVIAAARRHDALVHVDATQLVGRLPFDVGTLGADLATVSSHKLGGPRGAAALWVRRGVELRPHTAGGHQERDRRAGTEDVLAAVGFAAAIRVAAATQASEAARLARLRDALWDGIAGAVPDARRVADGAEVLPNTLNVVFDGADGETLLIGLDLAGVAVSSGSACTSGSLDPSHVLLAMGLSDAQARSAVRFSLGFHTTEADVARVVGLLPELVAAAREVAA